MKYVMGIVLMFFTSMLQAVPPTQQQLDQISNSTLNSVEDNVTNSNPNCIKDNPWDECQDPDDPPSNSPPGQQYSGVINSIDIINATLSADPMSCLNWEPVGACVWLRCALFACSIETSVKVYNYVPDLVIQSYDRAQGEPWTESQDLNEAVQGDAESSVVRQLIGMITGDADNTPIGGGQGSEGTSSNRDYRSIKFKLTDSYGNPGAAQYLAMNATTLFCRGTTIPYLPYHISNLDVVAWRWHFPEMFYPQSLIGFGVSDLRTTLVNNYGGYYPRGGFLYQQNTYKSGVLTAFRSAHVTTRDGQPHIYLPMGGQTRDGYWPPPPLESNDPNTGLFQMLYPDEQDYCKTWPQGEPSQAEQSDDGSYIWNFWRPYKCCERRGQTLLWHSG